MGETATRDAIYGRGRRGRIGALVHRTSGLRLGETLRLLHGSTHLQCDAGDIDFRPPVAMAMARASSRHGLERRGTGGDRTMDQCGAPDL